MKNIVYFDLETQKSAAEVGGWDRKRDMKMSVGVTFSIVDGQYRIFGEPQVNERVVRAAIEQLLPGIFDEFDPVRLIPLLGPPLGLLWGAHSMAFQQTDMPLARRGMDFGQRRAWHRQYRPESLGFGLVGLVFLIVPLANFFLAPALTVGGTLMVLELEEDLVPPDRPERRQRSRVAADKTQ